MLTIPPAEKPSRSWLYVWAWTLVIYTSIPLARGIRGFVADHWGRATFGYFVVSVVGLLTLWSILYLVRHREEARGGNYFWLLLTGGAYAFYASRLRAAPEETLHFLEYGLLGYLVFRALSHRVRDPLLYPCAALWCALIGTFDEIIQWAVPKRYFDWRDIRLNAISGALAQAALGLGFAPALALRRPAPASIGLVCRLAVACLLLFGLCISNTPRRVTAYAEMTPLLGFLRQNDSMTEFGYRHYDPDVGHFYSRFTQPGLQQEDNRRASTAAILLGRFPDAQYENFLETVTPGVDPFVHEARVRIFSRNWHMGRAVEVKKEPEAYRLHLDAACREQRILERYFHYTLAASRFGLTSSQRQWLSDHFIPGNPYVSKVSADLVTRFTEGEVWAAILAGSLLLLLAARRYGRPASTVQGLETF